MLATGMERGLKVGFLIPRPFKPTLFYYMMISINWFMEVIPIFHATNIVCHAFENALPVRCSLTILMILGVDPLMTLDEASRGLVTDATAWVCLKVDISKNCLLNWIMVSYICLLMSWMRIFTTSIFFEWGDEAIKDNSV